MRYILMLALGLTTVLSYAQSVNNPQPEITAVNPQPESVVSPSGENNMLGLPTVPIPVNNPQTSAKIELGDKLFHDKRFSVDGTVSCAKCHDDNQAFTDSLSVSVGHNGLTGTRNAPTVLNAAFNKTQFWDGREPDLEGQSKQPPINPVEGGLANYEPILEIVRKDSYYPAAFQSVFGVFTMITINNSRRNFIKNAGALAIGSALPISLMGEYWEKLFGPQFHSFDHKGVHFIVLNSVRTYDDWTYKRWPTQRTTHAGNGRAR